MNWIEFIRLTGTPANYISKVRTVKKNYWIFIFDVGKHNTHHSNESYAFMQTHRNNRFPFSCWCSCYFGILIYFSHFYRFDFQKQSNFIVQKMRVEFNFENVYSNILWLRILFSATKEDPKWLNVFCSNFIINFIDSIKWHSITWLNCFRIWFLKCNKIYNYFFISIFIGNLNGKKITKTFYFIIFVNLIK